MTEKERKEKALERLMDLAAKWQEEGIIDFLEGMTDIAMDSLSYMTDPKFLKMLTNLMYFAGLLSKVDPTMIYVMVGNFGKELEKQMTMETFRNPPKVGLFGLLGKMNDPDIQRALGFLFLMLKAFGKSIEESANTFVPMMEQMEKQFEQMKKARKEAGLEVD